jgi:type I restriction enzyme S subunit
MKHNHTQGSIQHLTQKLLVKFQIPILPREEQEQIVCILDAFIAIIENLKQQLQLRRKQYEYYRNQLFTFEGEKGVVYKKLCDICDIRGRIGFRGYTRNDQVNKGEGALTLTATNIKDGKLDFSNNTYISWAKYEESPEIMVKNGDIIVCQRGSIGKIALIEELEEEATINPQLLLMKDFKISSKYAITYFLSDYFQNDLRKIIGQGTIQMISQKDFGNLVIPLPSVEKQNDIIKSLSVFEASIENLNQQLILREKQYEYYKDRLLTFK